MIRNNFYIVYDAEKIEFIKSFQGHYDAQKYADDNGYKTINRTHPMHKNLIADLAKKSPQLSLILQQDIIHKQKNDRLKIQKLIRELKELTNLEDVCREWVEND